MPQFNHVVDFEKAKEYLKEINMYDKVIASSLFGGTSFEIIIAANVEYDSRNKKQLS